MTGMDSQFIANFHSGIVAYAALFSLILAIVVWYYSSGSKRAKEKAEAAHQAALQMSDAVVRSAEAAEKLLEQKEQVVTKQPIQLQSEIATNLWHPEFQLTHVRGLRYKLQNITAHPLDVLKVVNQDEFFRCDDIHQQFNPGESLDVLLGGVMGMPLPSNLILQIEGHNEPIYIQIPGESD